MATPLPQYARIALKALPKSLLVIHCFLGVFGIMLFLGQGIYMTEAHNALSNMADGPRMLFRSAHIYTLLLASLHLALAALSNVWRPLYWPMIGASLVSILSLLAVCYGFFFESFAEDLNRSMTKFGLFGLFGASIVLALNAICQGLGIGAPIEPQINTK